MHAPRVHTRARARAGNVFLVHRWWYLKINDPPRLASYNHCACSLRVAFSVYMRARVRVFVLCTPRIHDITVVGHRRNVARAPASRQRRQEGCGSFRATRGARLTGHLVPVFSRRSTATTARVVPNFTRTWIVGRVRPTRNRTFRCECIRCAIPIAAVFLRDVCDIFERLILAMSSVLGKERREGGGEETRREIALLRDKRGLRSFFSFFFPSFPSMIALSVIGIPHTPSTFRK